MLEGVTLGQFFPGTSPVHRMDPRVKVLLTIAMIVSVFLVRGFVGYALLFAFTALAARLARIKIKIMLRAVKPVLFIVAVTFVLNVFFATGGRVVFRWAFITITDQGLTMAVKMALRLVLLVFGTQLLTLTTSPISLTDALESLMRPLSKVGFPAHELAMMMSIALRFIPTLMEEANKIIMAQTARGADFESGNLIARAKAMLPLLVPLFVSAFRRADELALAMEARCYRGGANRTRLKVLRYTRLDLWATLSLFAAVALAIAIPI